MSSFARVKSLEIRRQITSNTSEVSNNYIVDYLKKIEEKIDKLQNEIEELKYSPAIGGIEFKKAQEHFEELKENQNKK